MKNIPILIIALYSTATISYAAQRYTGKLMDADCYNSKKVASQESGHKTYHSITKTCAATDSTTNFAVRITGSPYGADIGTTIKLDDSGNAQAMSEMNTGVLKTDRDGYVDVRVRGQLRGEVLTNASINPLHGKSRA